MTPGDGAAPTYAVVGSERPFEGKVAAVRIDEVVMPDGSVARREVVEHDRAVAVVAVDLGSDGGPDTVVLIEQYRHPLRRRLWELPAGLMDIDDEPAHVTAARELAEETGVAAASWSVLVDVVTSPGFCTESVRIYLATGLTDVEQSPATDEEADLRVVRVPIEEAVTAVFDGRIVNGMAVAGLLAAAEVLRTGRPTRPLAEDDPDGPPTVHVRSGIPDAPALDAHVPA